MNTSPDTQEGCRLGNVEDARNLYSECRLADSDSSHNRKCFRAMFEMEPPYEEAYLKTMGQDDRVNVNFDEAGGLLADAMTAYLDMMTPETLVTGVTFHGEPGTTRMEWSRAICEELTGLWRRWPRFKFNHLLGATHFVSNGVSFAVFLDEKNWQWEVFQLGDVLLPRDADALPGGFDMCFVTKHYKFHEVAAFTTSAAAARGWNVSEVKNVLKSSGKGNNATPTPEETFQKQLVKDLWMSEKSKNITLVHGFYVDREGDLHHVVFDATQSPAAKDFLFKAKLDTTMEQTVIPFTYGVGTTGKLQAISGMGRAIYGPVQISNRIRCQLAETAFTAGVPIFQAATETDLENFRLTHYGPYMLLTPGMNVVEQNHPNLSGTMLPALSVFSQGLRERTSRYNPENALPNSREMSRYEASARVAQASGINVTSLSLYYDSLELVFRESSRRALAETYVKAYLGGREVAKMKSRLTDLRLVPVEALNAFDYENLQVVKSVGAGSAAAAESAFRELMGLSAGFDPQGRKMAMRDRVANLMGSSYWADRYTPAVEDSRPPADAKFAMLENVAMMMGQEVGVLPNELHSIHLNIHLRVIADKVESVNSGESALTDGIEGLVMVYEHCAAHLEVFAGDPAAQTEAVRFRQMLQQAGEIITNGVRKLRAERERAAEQGGPDGSQGQTGPNEQDLRLQRSVLEAQTKLQYLQAKQELELNAMVAKGQVQLDLARAQAALKLAPGDPRLREL